MDRPGLLLMAALALAGCEDEPDPRRAQTTPIVEAPPAPPPAPSPAPTQALHNTGATIITGLDSAVTTRGAPNHLRFSLTNEGESAQDITLNAIALRGEGESPLLELGIHDQQLWLAGADSPTVIAPHAALSLDAKTEAQLLVYLDSWAADPLAERYEFEGQFTVDGEPQTVPVTIQRARREPIPR